MEAQFKGKLFELEAAEASLQQRSTSLDQMMGQLAATTTELDTTRAALNDKVAKVRGWLANLTWSGH